MTIKTSVLFIHRHYKMILAAIAIVFSISLFFAGAAGQEGRVNASTHNEKYFKCIEVENSDTLWSIAEDNMSEEYASVEAYIAEVKNINGLTSDKIYSGATLVVPYYAAPQ